MPWLRVEGAIEQARERDSRARGNLPASRVLDDSVGSSGRCSCLNRHGCIQAYDDLATDGQASVVLLSLMCDHRTGCSAACGTDDSASRSGPAAQDIAEYCTDDRAAADLGRVVVVGGLDLFNSGADDLTIDRVGLATVRYGPYYKPDVHVLAGLAAPAKRRDFEDSGRTGWNYYTVGSGNRCSGRRGDAVAHAVGIGADTLAGTESNAGSS